MKRSLACMAAMAVMLMMFAATPLTAYAAGKGDFNWDGSRNTSDVRDMIRMILHSGTPTQQQIWWGDYDVNDVIDTTDARTLLCDIVANGGQAIEYAKPIGTDCFGEKSIALLGDSISFGVGASDPIPENSYVSFVKKAVQWENNGNMNYGFASAYPTSWQPDNRADEIHGWPERSNKADGTTAWICDDNENGNRLTSVGMTSVTPWSTITYTLRSAYVGEYDYFCVYYHMEPDAAYFCVANDSGGEVADVNGSKNYIGTASDEEHTARTAFYRLADCPKDASGAPQIILCHDGSTKPLTITGIGYYKDISGNAVTFNSFTRGGMSLVNVGDCVLRQVSSADTLILGLGYNDFCYNHARVNAGEFAAQIDKLITYCNENGTHVIVNDYAWNNPVYSASWIPAQATANATVKRELRRFAKETGGVYIDQQALLGDAIINDLNTAGDGVHPSTYGHKLMAGNVIDAMGIWWTEEWK